jgi:hypothetical protein
MEGKDRLNLITRRIMGAAIEVHRHLGPGLLSLPTKHVQPMTATPGIQGGAAETAAGGLDRREA